MPEGDTIWRTARSLDAALAGRTVTAFASPVPAVATAARRLHVVGRKVERVEARGKHLLVRFEGGPVLHTHLRMSGRWSLYRPSARPAPSARGRVVLEAGEMVAVCWGAPVVELLSVGGEAVHPVLRRLGPDLLSDGFDAVAARARLRARGDLEIGVALMDQTALAGIGNVYKSEVLFLAGVHPRAPVATLLGDVLDRLIETARAQMKRNLGGARRRTTSAFAAEPLWVYRRVGRSCRRCGEPIRRIVQGEQVRSTYWCPGCQTGGAPVL
jgi:endonuclease VIII